MRRPRLVRQHTHPEGLLKKTPTPNHPKSPVEYPVESGVQPGLLRPLRRSAPARPRRDYAFIYQLVEAIDLGSAAPSVISRRGPSSTFGLCKSRGSSAGRMFYSKGEPGLAPVLVWRLRNNLTHWIGPETPRFPRGSAPRAPACGRLLPRKSGEVPSPHPFVSCHTAQTCSTDQ